MEPRLKILNFTKIKPNSIRPPIGLWRQHRRQNRTMNFTAACEDSYSEKCGQLQIEHKTILADPKYFETWRLTESGVKPNGVPQRSYC